MQCIESQLFFLLQENWTGFNPVNCVASKTEVYQIHSGCFLGLQDCLFPLSWIRSWNMGPASALPLTQYCSLAGFRTSEKCPQGNRREDKVLASSSMGATAQRNPEDVHQVGWRALVVPHPSGCSLPWLKEMKPLWDILPNARTALVGRDRPTSPW